MPSFKVFIYLTYDYHLAQLSANFLAIISIAWAATEIFPNCKKPTIKWVDAGNPQLAFNYRGFRSSTHTTSACIINSLRILIHKVF
jgi:hypothetical protein